MSMPFALEYTEIWLKAKNGFKDNECGVTKDALPTTNIAGSFFVGIDDAGVETGNDQTDSLREILTITIGIWVRPEKWSQRDRKTKLKMPKDLYLGNSWTLHDLERVVIQPKLGGLHNNWAYMTALNQYYNLPDEENGAEFNMPFQYKGRGRAETAGVDDGNTIEGWMGYRLRYRGLSREQKLRSTSFAQG